MFIKYKKMIIAFIGIWLVNVLLQTAARVYLFLAYTTPEITAAYKADIVKMFYTGLKYDIRVACYILAILLLLGLALILSNKTYKLWLKLAPPLGSGLTTLNVAITVVNIFYFKTFENQIDVFAFSIIDDDTVAILKTVWQDYPVIPFIMAICLSSIVFYRLYKAMVRLIEKSVLSPSRTNIFVHIAIFLLVTGLFILGARGSVGKFPLRRDNAQISTLQFINNLTPNAGMSIDWARGDYQKTSKFPIATDDEGRRILSEYFGKQTAPSLESFMATTRLPMETIQTPPNVVLLLMESMGSHLSLMTSPDMLGKLRPHWEEDFVFTRFMTEVSGTIGAVNRLLVWSADENISMSKAQQTDFKSNMLAPYIESGYRVIYITSGSGSWRNLNQFVPHLGAEFIEQNALEKLYPEAEVSPWGIPDEYMFKHIQTLLEEAESSGQPVLIFALSTTFHPPYKVPAGYTPPQFQLTGEQQKRFEQLGSTGGGLENVLGTFRYATDTLGDFLSWLKTHDIGEHSIVAITGDHNTRSIGYLNSEEAVLSNAVPFYIYIPPIYREFAHFDPLVAGSQKDIWPTLYNISLPNTRYYNSGCDLLAGRKAGCFGYGFGGTIIDETGVFYGNRRWQWQDNENPANLLISNPQPIGDDMLDIYNRHKLYIKLIEWQTNRQVNGQP